MDCGREFQGRDKNDHMKTHIALVHYQPHNLEIFDILKASDISKSIQPLDMDQKKACQPVKTECTFFCELCSEEFSHSGSLEKHKHVKHEGLGNNCDSCNYSSSTL